MRPMAEGLYSNSTLNSSSTLDSPRISIPASIPSKTQREQSQTVLIVGTRDLFRAAIRALLESVRLVEVVGEAQSDLDTFDMVERLRPTVLLMDASMDASLLPALRVAAPEMRVIALADTDRNLPHIDAVVPTSADMRTLLEAIRCETGTDETHLGTRRSSGPFGLTPREMDIVRAITEGRTNQEIAKKLSISLSTVKHYVTRVFDKLGVFNRVELVIFAMNHNLNGSGQSDISENPS